VPFGGYKYIYTSDLCLTPNRYIKGSNSKIDLKIFTRKPTLQCGLQKCRWLNVHHRCRGHRKLHSELETADHETSNQIKSNLFNKRTTRPLTLQYKQYTV